MTRNRMRGLRPGPRSWIRRKTRTTVACSPFFHRPGIPLVHPYRTRTRFSRTPHRRHRICIRKSALLLPPFREMLPPETFCFSKNARYSSKKPGHFTLKSPLSAKCYTKREKDSRIFWSLGRDSGDAANRRVRNLIADLHGRGYDSKKVYDQAGWLNKGRREGIS